VPDELASVRISAHEHARLAIQARERTRDECRSLHAAVANRPLRRGAPALADVLPGEVHDRLDALEARRVQRSGRGIPRHVVALAASNADHADAVALERLHEGGAEESRRAGDCDGAHG
jgi:hypothetical protein